MTPDLFRKLAALGLSHEQMAGVLGIIQDACDQVDAKAEEGREKARARWHRWKNKQGTNVSKRLQTDANASKPLTRVEDSSSKIEIPGQEEKKDTSPAAPSKRGTRIPDDFVPDIGAAVADGVPQAEAIRQAASFCDYWRSKPGKDGLKLDWPATWRVWYRRSITTTRSTAPPNRRRNFADVALDRMNGHGSEGIFGGGSDAQRFPSRERESGPDDGNLRGGVAGRYLASRN